MKLSSPNRAAIPEAALQRLSTAFGLLQELRISGTDEISSAEIGRRIGVPAHSVRKDISYVAEAGRTGAGYDVEVLQGVLDQHLGFGRKRRTCIVGLGRMGGALLAFQELWAGGFPIVAGFDASTNKLETIRTNVPLFPAYQMADVIKREGIELAIVAVPAEAVQRTVQALIAGGITGIVNFTSAVVAPAGEGVFIRNIDLVNELRILSSLLTLHNGAA
jgi:redox-sensing transcriptional repressor